MKKIRGLLDYRLYWVSSKKHCLFLLTIIILFIGGISCNDKNEANSVSPYGELSANTNSPSGDVGKSINSALRIMYLENFNDQSRNQLAKLVCDENYKKLIFQFYTTKSGDLTLVAFAAKQNSNDFNPNYQILGVINDAVASDIQDKEVFMGDQKLEFNSGFKELRDAVNKGSKNDSTKNYIIFTPDLKRLTPRGPSFVIEFSITFSSTLKGLDPQITSKGFVKLNPSPPYN
ncbi:MAG: hypothetical protein H7Y07_10085 [Pyrinomonadaceae bacterium]|nr:hypothetical protein [Sphingobacteriaceae bacterium]